MVERILVVGFGSIGRLHLQILRKLLPRADIRVLRHRPTNEIYEHSNGTFSDLNEAMSFAPQVAVIANPATFHMSIATQLAEIGTHLLIEKPLAASLSGVENLIDISKKKNIIVMAGYNLRFLPSLQSYRNFLSDGIIGSVLSVRCDVGQYLPTWRQGGDYRKEVSAKRALGGGVLLELTHELDYLRWIFGEIDWVKATLSRQSDLEIDVEDTAHLVLGFSSKKNERQLVGMLNMDFIRHDPTRLCLAIGEKGTLRWNGITGAIDLFKLNSNGWEEVDFIKSDREDSYFGEWRHFLECIANFQQPMVTAEDGLRILRIVDASIKSDLKDGNRINV